jgi:hypothetical protein
MTPPDPARAARLTAIAERLDKLEQLTGQSTEHGDVRFLLAHVETLTQQVAMVTGTSSSIYAAGLLQRAERAEQQRDTAHAALREIKADIRWQSGAHYEGCNCTFCTVIAKTDAALAASAPQKEEPR